MTAAVPVVPKALLFTARTASCVPRRRQWSCALAANPAMRRSRRIR